MSTVLLSVQAVALSWRKIKKIFRGAVFVFPAHSLDKLMSETPSTRRAGDYDTKTEVCGCHGFRTMACSASERLRFRGQKMPSSGSRMSHKERNGVRAALCA